MKRLVIGSAAAVMCLAAATVLAADFDGSKPLICSAIEANDCAMGVGCEKGLAEDVNAPQFVRVDFAGKKMSARGRTAPIDRQARENGTLILQGLENGRAWSITITEEGGWMVGAIAGSEEGFVIFGACTPL
jgi:hypothetical protein